MILYPDAQRHCSMGYWDECGGIASLYLYHKNGVGRAYDFKHSYNGLNYTMIILGFAITPNHQNG